MNVRHDLDLSAQFPAGGHLMQFLGCLESALISIGGKLEPSAKLRLQGPIL
jgi:hypothetical protein